MCVFQSATATGRQRSATLIRRSQSCLSAWTSTGKREGAECVLVAGRTPLESTVRPASPDSTGLTGCVTSACGLFELRHDCVNANCNTSPYQVSAEEEDPCIPCSCDAHGSISQSCVADSSQATPSTKISFCWRKSFLSFSISHLCPEEQMVSGPQSKHIHQLLVSASTSFTF